jgi:hypothetical protein
MKKTLLMPIVVLALMQIGCTHKTPQEYYKEIMVSKNVFHHTAMSKDTSNYKEYLRAMSAPFFGDHCDYYIHLNGMAFMCVSADQIPCRMRTQLGFAPGDTLLQQLATGMNKFGIGTTSDDGSIRVKLPRPEQLRSWNAWELLCTHEAVHVKQLLEGRSQGSLDELSAYLAEKNALKKMNPVWYDSFCTSFVPFYKDCGFCPEMLDAVKNTFGTDSLSQIEQATLPGALMIFAAMEAKKVGVDDTADMNKIIQEISKFCQSKGYVKYY